MATIHWTCKNCKRMNERRGITPLSEQVKLACPGCQTTHYVNIYWMEQRHYTVMSTKAKLV
jgi:hypothetical protein